MLTRLYIEALLVDPDAADQVWDAWHKGEIGTYWAVWMWGAIVSTCSVDSRSSNVASANN
jgi:hypothetical protein